MLKYLQAEAVHLAMSAVSAATNTDRSRMPGPAHFKTRSKVQSLISLCEGSGGDGLQHTEGFLISHAFKTIKVRSFIYAMFHFVC